MPPRKHFNLPGESDADRNRRVQNARQKAWKIANPKRAKEIRAKADLKRAAEGPGRSTKYTKVWRANNLEKAREAIRNSKLKHQYGMTREELRQMLANQEGLCAVCSKQIEIGPLSKEWKSIAVHIDHDHATGKVRGLVCSACNLVIGFARDSVTVLRNAAGYLEVA